MTAEEQANHVFSAPRHARTPANDAMAADADSGGVRSIADDD
jgi:hypothetical protein